MNEFTFWIPIHGKGKTVEEAWDNAWIKTLYNRLRDEEWTRPPEDTFTEHQHIPTGEILGGFLSAGFGIDHGPEVEEINPHGYEED